MKPLGLISQIIAIGLAVGIVVFFVRPTFTEIGDLQTEVQQYAVERERVTETNRDLATRVAELESVAVADRARLATYLPTFIDEVAVLRDIEIIAQNAGVNYTTLQYNGELIDTSDEARLGTVSESSVQHEFNLTIEGSYSRLKDFFSLLEQNQYPLQVYMLDISALDGGFLLAEASIITYTTTTMDDE